MNSLSQPKIISIGGVDYPVRILNSSCGRDNGYVMIEGKPVASIEFMRDVASRDHIQRAELAIASFKANKGKHSLLPTLGYGFFDRVTADTPAPTGHYEAQAHHQFDESMLEGNFTSECYSTYGVPHMAFTIKVVGKWQCLEEVTFLIWDVELMRKIARIVNESSRKANYPPAYDADIPGFHEVFEALA